MITLRVNCSQSIGERTIMLLMSTGTTSPLPIQGGQGPLKIAKYCIEFNSAVV